MERNDAPFFSFLFFLLLPSPRQEAAFLCRGVHLTYNSPSSLLFFFSPGFAKTGIPGTSTSLPFSSVYKRK